MTDLEYWTDWFASKIHSHSAVSSTTSRPSGNVLIRRRERSPITVAPVSVDVLEVDHIDQILATDPATIVCLIPTSSHYLWAARERALTCGSSVHTMRDLHSSLLNDDPRSFLHKSIAYPRERLKQHSMVHSVNMVCEASMTIVRHNHLNSVLVAIEEEYEFSEEALVRALERHPDAGAVLNWNLNGRSTSAALRHAEDAHVGLFSFTELMGALNYDGDTFVKYRSPDESSK